MARKPLSMHVATIVRKHGGKTYVSHLLRHSYRDGTHVRHRTLANLSHLPEPLLDLIRRSLQGEAFVPATQAFRITHARAHGHVHAVLGTIRALGLDTLLAPRPSPQRQRVLALLAARVLFPCSKLATPRHWQATTLADELGVSDATADDLYAALDWLGRRQAAIEDRLAARHLHDGGLALYDVSSSFYYGRTCPLARHGYDRDGKKGLPIIVYGLLTDPQGRPVALEVYPGNTADATTVPDQLTKLRHRFGCTRLVLVGDRGMLTDTQIDNIRTYPGLGGISALRSAAIRRWLYGGPPAAFPVRRGQPGRDHQPGLPRGAADGLLQPAAGGRTPSQAAGPAGTDGGGLDTPGGRGGAADGDAADADRDRPEGRTPLATLEGGQALPLGDR